MGRQQVRTSRTGRQMRGTSYTDRNRAYVDGNTVRKMEVAPQRLPQEEKKKKQDKNAERAARANRQRALQMGPGYLLFLTMAVMMTVCICVAYVQLQSDINNRMRNIAVLEGQVLDLQTENDAAMKRIETSVNLEEIKKIAMEDMGMVYPNQEQIVFFEVDSSDFMNQYRDIPGK